MSETTGYNGVVHRLRELLELIGVPAEHCLPERLVERIEVAKEDVRHDRAALATAQRDLDAALDRARVAEQRIETAKKSLCGLLDPSKTMFCTKDSLVNEVERIVSTLGRFVADQEGT